MDRVVCMACRGDGLELCPSCDGAGYDEDTDEACEWCEGIGKIECSECDGLGVVEVDEDE